MHIPVPSCSKRIFSDGKESGLLIETTNILETCRFKGGLCEFGL